MARVKKKSVDEILRISAAAQAAGVSKQTVDYYVMIGLIEPLRLGDRHGRFFDKALVRRIRLIRRLNQSGYTLQSIRQTYLRRKEKKGRRA